jgi:hypothetical protein
LCGLIKRFLARLFGCLYEAFRDKEDQQDLPPYVDPHFYQQTKDLKDAQEKYHKLNQLKILKTYKIKASDQSRRNAERIMEQVSLQVGQVKKEMS